MALIDVWNNHLQVQLRIGLQATNSDEPDGDLVRPDSVAESLAAFVGFGLELYYDVPGLLSGSVFLAFVSVAQAVEVGLWYCFDDNVVAVD